MRRVALGLVALVTCASGEPLSRPMNRRYDETAGRVATIFYVNLKIGNRYVFETKNTRPKNSDPALVVVEEERPVAYNEDRPRTAQDKRHMREARLEFIPRRVVPHAVQVRVQERGLPGTCDVFMNGKLLGRQVPFGERFRSPVPRSSGMPPRLIHRPWETEMDQYNLRESDRRP